MHARVTRLTGTPENLRQSISTFEESTAAVRRLPGCAGIVLVADTGAGRAIVASYWESEGAMNASEEAVAGARNRITAENGVEVGRVERYEVSILERSQPVTAGACVRLISGQLPPGRIAAVETAVREKVLPVITGLPGFRSMVTCVDRQSGAIFVGSSWDTPADRQASEATLTPLRQQILAEAGATVEIEHYDVAYAHAQGALQRS